MSTESGKLNETLVIFGCFELSAVDCNKGWFCWKYRWRRNKIQRKGRNFGYIDSIKGIWFRINCKTLSRSFSRVKGKCQRPRIFRHCLQKRCGVFNCHCRQRRSRTFNCNCWQRRSMKFNNHCRQRSHTFNYHCRQRNWKSCVRKSRPFSF